MVWKKNQEVDIFHEVLKLFGENFSNTFFDRITTTKHKHSQKDVT